MNETKRTTRNLLRAFAGVCIVGVTAAIVVTFLTGSERITLSYEAMIPSLTADDNQCFEASKGVARDADGVEDAFLDCELLIPTSPEYPDAQSVWPVLVADDIFAYPRFVMWRCWSSDETIELSLDMGGSARTLGSDTADIVSNIQSPMTNFDINPLDSVLDNVCGPSWWSTSETWWDAGATEALAAGTTMEIAIRVIAEVGPNAADTNMGWSYVGGVEGADLEAVSNFRPVQVIVTPDPDVEIVWVETTIREQIATGLYEPFEPNQTRALGLGTIWGTTLGLLALVGVVGALVSRPLLGVAKRAESNREEADRQRDEADRQKDEAERMRLVAERNGTQLEHVLSATHHELSREIIQVGFVMDDLSDEGVDVVDLQGSFERLQEGRDSIAALAQLGGDSAVDATQTVAASDLAVLTDGMQLTTTGGELTGVDRLLVRTLVKNAGRLAEGSGCSSLSVEVHGNDLHLVASAGDQDAWGREETGAVSDHWGVIDQVVKAHAADVLVQGTPGNASTMVISFPAVERTAVPV